MNRFIINEAEVIKIKNEMFNLGYKSIRSINRAIGCRFDAIINGYSIPIHTAIKIQNVIGRVIELQEYNRCVKINSVQLNEDLAEFIGIMLGDGNIGIYSNAKNHLYYRCGITLNCNEHLVISNVVQLCHTIFGLTPHIRKRKNANCIEISMNKREVVNTLISNGLKNGSKIKNESGIPQWILENQNYIVKCLKGLIDTDGSIYINKSNQIVYIGFTTHCKQLLNDVANAFSLIDVKITKASWRYLNITSKRCVKKFLDMAKPIKWQMFLEEHPNGSALLEYKNRCKYNEA